jgi:hypothetical protein
MNEIITYEELFIWRNVCEFLYRSGAVDRGKWTDFGMSQYVCNCSVAYAWEVLAFDKRERRQLLWDAWRIQLVRYEDRVKKKHQGWVLRSNWEYKIDFLEKVVLFDANPYGLPMPWLRNDMPKPWDVVLGGMQQPEPGSVVMGGRK